MRLSRRYKRLIPVESKKRTGKELDDDNDVKEAVPVRPLKKFQKIFRDPDFGIRMMTMFLTMRPDNVRMERRINTMNSSMEKVRNLTELINTTMQSLKIAAEAPRQIKRLLK